MGRRGREFRGMERSEDKIQRRGILMDPAVRKELDTLLTMVMAWTSDKIRIAGTESGWDFLAGDLHEEIGDHVCPYIRRMRECKYITREECGEFLEACYA